ncbi:MAG: hypothetical protein HS126_32010 [Anaerolineales bacterium]|nr:hypothetical protein [Anaerolineales bacterium]
MDFLRNLFGKKQPVTKSSGNEPSQPTAVPSSGQPSSGIAQPAPLKDSKKIQTVGGDELFKICTEILLRLQLTYVEGIDETSDLARYLMEDKNFSEKLATGIATATFKAYKISGGNTDKYFPLCIEYFKKM